MLWGYCMGSGKSRCGLSLYRLGLEAPDVWTGFQDDQISGLCQKLGSYLDQLMLEISIVELLVRLVFIS
jgi:hypothetical protein